jgi:tryptophan synthase beta chain
VTDAEAMEAFRLLARTEGIVPAIESAHALAGALTLGPRLPARPDGRPPLILVSLSGRGDKDVDTAVKWFGIDTSGTGSESGARIDASAALPPVELELGGASTGAGEEL